MQADKDELWNDFKVLKSEKEKAEKKYLEKETKFKDDIKKEKERNKGFIYKYSLKNKV